MSGFLWKYYLEDDLESFLQVLAEAAVASRSSHQKATIGPQTASFGNTIASPGSFATSPGAAVSLKSPRPSLAAPRSSYHDISLTRADINRKDGKGRTLLHYAASSVSKNGPNFALALIAHPHIDLYVQDAESGWTPLHRAFYFGNIAVARAIVERDAQDAIGQGGSGTSAHAGNLIRVKDHEGNAPYDILTETIQNRTLRHRTPVSRVADEDNGLGDSDEDLSANRSTEHITDYILQPDSRSVHGDELYMFGSNRNNTLGLGNQDDRQFPERVLFKRPDHLYKRFHKRYFESRSEEVSKKNVIYGEKLRSQLPKSSDVSSLPSLIRALPIHIQDAQMSKYHSAVLTSDPVSNLYICGHGFGGRLGTGKEATEFRFVCIEVFGSSRKRIVTVALGQDHTLAVSDDGEVFSWGMNSFGQLGHGMSKTSINAQEPVQLTPKQIFGAFKREKIIGVAASQTHSVAHTHSSLYTFGKNDGQLGITDAGARSLELQTTPRKVAASRFSSPIESVAAIDRATICLLQNQEVHVFTNYGVVKVAFPFPKYHSETVLGTRQGTFTSNSILKVAGGGDTICALAETGHVCAVTVHQRIDSGSSSTASTTNPNKIKAALSDATCIWSPNRAYMAAKDIAVDQDGSIILANEAGTVWRRVRRATLPGRRPDGAQNKKSKDYKFMRIPGLTRVTAVRASATGAYCAIRQDSNVTREQIIVKQSTLWSDLFALLPFKGFADHSPGDDHIAHDHSAQGSAYQRAVRNMLKSKDMEQDMAEILRSKQNKNDCDVTVGTSISDIKIPAHQLVMAARSRLLRDCFVKVKQVKTWSSELFDMNIGDDGNISILFHGLDFLSICELIMYAYTDGIVGFCSRPEQDPKNAYRYRQIRLELMKIAAKLELKALESAVRRMNWVPELCLDLDYELAISDLNFFSNGDTLVQLEDGELLVHSALVSRRCPFFEVLFEGRASGRWLSERRGDNEASAPIAIDMKHVELRTFRLVLTHIYTDKGEELFESIATKNLDEFLDIVLEVLSAANELMLDRLLQACQRVLGRYVNTRNVCQLLNAVAPCSVEEFKNASLEYICHNLEAMLTNHLLDELDEELIYELEEVIRDNQLSTLPFAKSGRAEAELHERHPDLAEILDRNRRAKIDAINLQAKYNEQGGAVGVSFDLGDDDDYRPRSKGHSRYSAPSSSSNTPAIKALSPVLSPNENSGRLPLGTSLSPSLEGTSVTIGSPATPLNLGPLALQMDNMASSQSQKANRPDASLEVVQTFATPAKSTPDITVPRSSQGKGSPWATAPLPSAKLGIKEIMNQAAASRTSSISLGLASQQKSEDGSPGNFGSRISQKERRKSQHNPQSEHVEEPTPNTTGGLNSPWQTIPSKGKVISKSNNSLQSAAASGPTQNIQQRSSTTPQLTMRQTVANTPAAPRQSSSSSATGPQVGSPSQKRSVSSPQVPSSMPQSSPGMSSDASKPIEIKSIRHQPRPNTEVSPTFYMHQSMAEIFSQQQAEKNVIKENAMKRSLQEIQQEQEFQEWWDQESKKVMEEQAAAEAAAAAAAAAASASPKAGGGASRGRGKHRDRDPSGGAKGRNRARRRPGGRENQEKEKVEPADRADHK